MVQFSTCSLKFALQVIKYASFSCQLFKEVNEAQQELYQEIHGQIKIMKIYLGQNKNIFQIS